MSDYRRPAVPPANRPPVRPSGRPAAGRARGDHDRFDGRETNRGAADYRRAPARQSSPAARDWEQSGRQPVDSARSNRRSAARSDTGRGLRGVVWIVAIFLITLAGAAADSFLGVGLSKITLGALVLSTAVATWVVRRRDLLSLVVAPPLIFVAVTVVNVALAPSASVNLPTIATLLIRGFPAMALATGVAVVVWLVRAAARR